MTRACETCGTPFDLNTHGRHRRFCSQRCRKAQYDKQCVDCGTRVSGTDPGDVSPDGHRCPACARTYMSAAQREYAAVLNARRAERCAVIERMWNDGWSLQAIANVLGSSVNAIGNEMVRMRDEGYVLPFRYPKDQATNGRKTRVAA